MHSEGTTVALNFSHSPDPKLLSSGAYCNTNSYEKAAIHMG